LQKINNEARGQYTPYFLFWLWGLSTWYGEKTNTRMTKKGQIVLRLLEAKQITPDEAMELMTPDAAMQVINYPTQPQPDVTPIWQVFPNQGPWYGTAPCAPFVNYSKNSAN
jgi:hypothetical protein